MKTTPEFKLKKPDSTDYFKIADFNDNADIIDQNMKGGGAKTDLSNFEITDANKQIFTYTEVTENG